MLRYAYVVDAEEEFGLGGFGRQTMQFPTALLRESRRRRKGITRFTVHGGGLQ